MAEYQSEDTIAAIATPPGEGGIAVIRISGPQATEIAGKIFFKKSGQSLGAFEPERVRFGVVKDSEGEVLDVCLLTYFRGPRSFSGEDTVEISTHGGEGVSRMVLDRILNQGARPAEPGEFTKRAFLNGKIDLTQAEAVADLIHAKSKLSVEVAARQLAGSLSGRLKNLRDSVMRLYAHLEAFIDFPEEDLEVFGDKEISSRFLEIAGGLQDLAASFRRGSLLREGISVVIAGRPNVGKSSLFNALLERDRALVSPYPGTTRDHLEENLEVCGLSVRLFDTAGFTEEADHPLDRLGIERTRRAIAQADMYLFVMDASEPVTEEDRRIFLLLDPDKPRIVILNKSDLSAKAHPEEAVRMTGEKEILRVSSVSRSGLDNLEEKIFKAALGGFTVEGGECITRLRHKNALESGLAAIERAKESFRNREPLELVTVEILSALRALKELLGEVYSEDLLDVIFSEFCIGK